MYGASHADRAPVSQHIWLARSHYSAQDVQVRGPLALMLPHHAPPITATP